MKAGIRIKTALKPFASDGAKFDYGTYMIPVQNQNLSGEALTQKLAEVAQKYSLKVTGVNTGLMAGIDLGSRLFVTLELPKIAMLVGDGVRSYDAGEIWHLLDTRYNIPLTKLIFGIYLELTYLTIPISFSQVILENGWIILLIKLKNILKKGVLLLATVTVWIG